MSEWDDFGQGPEKRSNSVGGGSLDIGLTVAALLAVAVVSFALAYLTKEIVSRPFWLLGICNAAPVAALMGVVVLKEKIAPSMTPSTSRKSQTLLAVCSVLMAFVVGCFCQISNVEAREPRTELVGEGWSDLLIILDKSGSMSKDNRDQAASKAVKKLVSQMDDEAQVAMLIDVGWKENNTGSDIVPLSERRLDFAPLSAQRKKLLEMAEFPLYINENFPRAFDVAFEMLEQYKVEGKRPTILMISDGADCTNKFRAVNYADRLNEMNVKVYYLYVDPDFSGEVSALAESTGGSSFYVSNLDKLAEKMQEVVKIPVYETVYRDALRDIQISDSAKIVTGSLLLVLGALIGISLTIMLSLQGQRRFQMILSPLMAALAFLLLAYGKEVISEDWVREGTAFTLLGVVLMRSNRGTIQGGQGKAIQTTSATISVEEAW